MSTFFAYSWGVGTGILMAIVFAYAQEVVRPFTCGEARLEVTSMQTCLANRPHCVIIDGPASMKVYHEAKVVLKEERCNE